MNKFFFKSWSMVIFSMTVLSLGEKMRLCDKPKLAKLVLSKENGTEKHFLGYSITF